jgi:hypothetical protein
LRWREPFTAAVETGKLALHKTELLATLDQIPLWFSGVVRLPAHPTPTRQNKNSEIVDAGSSVRQKKSSGDALSKAHHKPPHPIDFK